MSKIVINNEYYYTESKNNLTLYQIKDTLNPITKKACIRHTILGYYSPTTGRGAMYKQILNSNISKETELTMLEVLRIVEDTSSELRAFFEGEK